MNVVLPRPQLGSGVELFTSAITVPYAAGMDAHPVTLDAGKFVVIGPRREPALLIRIKRALAGEAVVVVPKVGNDKQPPVVFAPFTAEGTLLPGFVPRLQPGEDGTGDFTVNVTVHRTEGAQRNMARPSSLPAALDDDEAANLIEAMVLEGRFARLLYLGTLEKQRCIRQAREIAALRYRRLNYSGGLDDRGLDYGVPRLDSLDESDADYRARLAIYSRWRLATPAGFAEALNGPGQIDDPNRGLPSLVGIKDRFRIVEEINDLSIATKLVAVGEEGETQLDNFHRILQAHRLVDLDSPAPEMLPDERRELYEDIRVTLRDELTRVGGANTPRFLAPLNAITLDRTVRLLRNLGHNAKITLKRAYDPAGGSRHELGLGVDIEPLTKTQLEKLGSAVEGLANEEENDDITNLARSLQPRTPKDDPLGRWLFEPCGFRTVHLLDSGDLHLSPLPTFGQWIDGPGVLPNGGQATYESRYHASGSSTGIHTRAQAALDGVADVFTARKLKPVPPHLSPKQLNTVIHALAATADPATLPDSLDASVRAGIITTDAKTYATQLTNTFNLDQIVAFSISKSALDDLTTGAKLRDALTIRIDALQEAGFYSVRGIWDPIDTRLLLLASVSQLPGATFKVGEPPPATFYWYETRVPSPISGMDDPLVFTQRRGGRATVRTGRMGISLLVCIGYSRRGLADPFEVRVELPDDALLDMDQYGYLMNLLEALYPIGIEINTFQIRRSHVDVNGDGKAEFITSRASRSYFQYQHRRPFGSGRGRNQRGDTNE